MAFPTSTCPQASSKTTLMKDQNGTLHCPLTGTRTTTKPKCSLLTTQSTSSLVCLPIPVTTADRPFRDPVNWLAFTGHWGDKRYPHDDKSQSCFLSIDAFCRYTDGPTGPAFKQLQRKKVCPDNGIPCIVRSILVQRASDEE